MYCLLNQNDKNIVNFLADSADDFPFIIDNCAAGSTITITDGNVHKKAPSGRWIHIAGDGEDLPYNNAEVAAAEPTGIYGDRPCTEYQSNIKINKNGLVTGTLHLISDNSLYGGDQKSGHFLIVDCPTPEGADSLTTYKGSTVMRENITPDGFLMTRIENLGGESKLKLVFKKGEEEVTSFTLYISQLILE